MSTNKSNKGSYLVCDGAQCMCMYGSKVAKLTVTKQKKVYVNKKLVATDEETVFSPGLFGNCYAKYSSPPCVFAAQGKWMPAPGKTFYESGDQKILTEDASIVCSTGSGKVEVISHGQRFVILRSHWGTVTSEISPNCLISTSELQQIHVKLENNNPSVSVEYIRYLKLHKSKKPTAVEFEEIKGEIVNNSPKTIYARKGDRLRFEACNNSRKLISANVHWVVFRKGDQGNISDIKFLHESMGSPYFVSFDKEGTYYIEGFGNNETLKKYRYLVADPSRAISIKEYNKCRFRIEVISRNRVSGIVPLTNARFEKKTGKEEKDIIVLRQGLQASIKINTLLNLEWNEKIFVQCSLTPALYNFSLDNDIVDFLPLNATEELIFKTGINFVEMMGIPIIVKPNGIMGVYCSSKKAILNEKEYSFTDKGNMIRPGTIVVFEVKMEYEDAERFETDKVEWLVDNQLISIAEKTQLENRSVACKGAKIERKFSSLTEECVIEARIKGIISSKVESKYTLRICHNEIADINAPQGHWFTGKWHNLNATDLFNDYIPEFDGKVTWSVELLEKYDSVSTEQYQMQSKMQDKETVSYLSETEEVEGDLKLRLKLKAGKYKIGAVLKKRVMEMNEVKANTKYIELEVKDAEAVYWEFVDSEKRPRNVIGLNQKFGIHLLVPAWASETINLALFVKKSNNEQCKIDIDELKTPVKLSSRGEFFITIPKTSELWSEHIKDHAQVPACLDFVITAPPCPCKDVVITTKNRTDYYRCSKINQKETKQLRITNEKGFEGYFADSDGEKLKKIVKYGTPVKAVIFCTNIAEDDMFTFKLFENTEGIDKEVASVKDLTVDEKKKNEGIITVHIPTNSADMGISEAHHGERPKHTPRIFYFELHDKDLPEKESLLYAYPYPFSTNDEYIVHPKLKPADENEQERQDAQEKIPRNYFFQLKVAGTDELNRTLKSCCPVILGGEKLEEKKKEKRCYCNRNFTIEEVKRLVYAMNGHDGIWTKNTENLDNRSYEALTLELNNAFSKYGISKCIQKIAILATTAIETGFFTCLTERGSNDPSKSSNSSKSKYKGRGMIQLTGALDKSNDRKKDLPGIYKIYQDEQAQNYDLVNKPELLAQKLVLAIDSGCWFFAEEKDCPGWESSTSGNDKIKAAIEWKKNKYKPALGKKLNEIAILMEEDEETYFFLISKLCHGYSLSDRAEKPAALNYPARLLALERLKKWFQFDKDICNNIVTREIYETAPWMEIAVQELRDYGGKKETTIHDRIKEYHLYGGRINANGKTPWCASFACWCLMQSGYPNPQTSGSRLFMDCSVMKKHNEPFYGAVAVFSDCNAKGTSIYSSGHVAFLYGKLSNGKHLFLGGNQGDMVKLSSYDCSGNACYSYKKDDGTKVYKIFRGFYKPQNYDPTAEDLALKGYSSEKAANQAFQISVNESGLGENTQ